VNKLDEKIKKKFNIISAKVLEVSTVGCEEYINSLPKGTINLHFGVFNGSKHFRIEQSGYNLKDFGIPDVRGYEPKNECINDECEENKPCNTKLNVNQIVTILKKQFKVVESDDPGRYICNYIYYCSLNKNCNSLFVHFPSFHTIDEETQYQFVIKLLETIHELYYQNILIE